MMHRFSPQNLSLMEFRSETDYELCSKIRATHPLLGETGCRFRRELHPRDDAPLFHQRSAKPLQSGELPIFEGKMISQYRRDNAPSSFFAIEQDARVMLLRKEISRLADFVRDSRTAILEGEQLPKKKAQIHSRLAEIFKAKKFKLDYECLRTVYRRVGRSTDERTIIAAVLPQEIILTDTLTYRVPLHYELTDAGILSRREPGSDSAHLHAALLNSLVLNYYIRNKISATVNMFYVYELPIPAIDIDKTKQLAKSAEVLSQKAGNLKERANLEVFIARDVYQLNADDWEHLTSTFTFGGDSDSKAELDEIIRLSKKLWNER
jgi:hypothetical protein